MERKTIELSPQQNKLSKNKNINYKNVNLNDK